MFRHYLITRFNIIQAWYNQYTTVSGVRIQSEEWLTERFRLFEEYCLPSVAQQTTKDFEWLVLFNSETPEPFKARFAGYQEQCAAFTPLYLEPYGDENALVLDYILAHTPADQYQQVLTTRLDNDDTIRCDYLQMMQEAVKPEQTDLFFNYRYGYQYNVRTQLAYLMDYPSNHYVSRVELLGPQIQTVLCNHSELDKRFEYQELDNVNGGAWLEVITDVNADNRLRKDQRPLRLSHPEQFFGDKTPQITCKSKIVYYWAVIGYYAAYVCRVCHLTYAYRWTKRKFEKHVLHRV